MKTVSTNKIRDNESIRIFGEKLYPSVGPPKGSAVGAVCVIKMTQYDADSWKTIFRQRDWLTEEMQLAHPDTGRLVTVIFEKGEHKLSEFHGADDLTISFKSGHFVYVHLWSQIIGVQIFG